jgi:hypothetical protein
MNKVLEMLEQSKKEVSSLLVSSKGIKKETIYKSELFIELSDKEKKVARKKIRNYVNSLFTSIIANESNKKECEQLVKTFVDFYKSTYIVNDYSFASIASENTKDKEVINNALAIIKKVAKVK